MPPSNAKPGKPSQARRREADYAAQLAAAPLFAGLDPADLQKLATGARLQSLPSGGCLYREGDSPDAFYLLLSGRLRLTSGERLLGYVGRLQPVGEAGAISGQPREATVHAVRDSRLLCVERKRFLDFLHAHPGCLMDVTRLLIDRMRQQARERRAAATATQGLIAILPTSARVPAMELAAPLTEHLSGWPTARLVSARHVDAALGKGTARAAVDDGQADQRVHDWVNDLEARHRYLILVADNAEDDWALRCLRLADRVLVLTEADTEPHTLPVMRRMQADALIAPLELVILRPEGEPSPHTRDWSTRLGARSHYYLHPWEPRDLAALARQMTGRGVGLVLGGGGARGFAHIGLIRALHELDIPVDVMGGTSMGAFVAALLACDFDHVEMLQLARETFVNNNYLNDYNLPRVSLIRGRRFLARLQEIFGERQIEELPRSYYCVSTNLSTGAAVAHEHGPLANWVGTSMCVPGVAPPVAHEGELLCDGGVVDNLPTDIMQGLERGAIIASSVSSEDDLRAPGHGVGQPDPQALYNWQGPSRRPRLSEILLRTATLTADTVIQRESVDRADLYIRMPVQDYGMFDWAALDQLAGLGYRHALEVLAPQRDELLQAVPLDEEAA